MRTRLGDEVPGLLRYARTIAPDGQLAEDLVQDTLLRALQRAESFHGDASLASWLHRILHNLAVDRFRRDREDATDDVGREVEQRWREDSYTVDAAIVVAVDPARLGEQGQQLKLDRSEVVIAVDVGGRCAARR